MTEHAIGHQFNIVNDSYGCNSKLVKKTKICEKYFDSILKHIYFSLMFDDIDFFRSFGEKRNFVQKQSYLCETFV